MQFGIPYEDIISVLLDDKYITYKKSSENDKVNIYIIEFSNKAISPLSTMIGKTVSHHDVRDKIIESLCGSEQGKTIAEISYLAEHFALADCTDYSVDLDSNAYLVYVKLSETTEIYGAISMRFSLSQVSMFFRSKRSSVNPKDREALHMLSTIERNIQAEKLMAAKKANADRITRRQL